jgi:hypothetical protein
MTDDSAKFRIVEFQIFHIIWTYVPLEMNVEWWNLTQYHSWWEQEEVATEIQPSYLCITPTLVWTDIHEGVKFKYQVWMTVKRLHVEYLGIVFLTLLVCEQCTSQATWLGSYCSLTCQRISDQEWRRFRLSGTWVRRCVYMFWCERDSFCCALFQYGQSFVIMRCLNSPGCLIL